MAAANVYRKATHFMFVEAIPASSSVNRYETNHGPGSDGGDLSMFTKQNHQILKSSHLGGIVEFT